MSEVTGSEIIRQTLYARAFKGHLSYLARDLGVGVAALDSFSRGEGKLPPEILQALAKEFFGAEFDPALDRLRSANRQEPRAIGPGPPPIWELMELPKFKGGPAERSFRPVKPEPPQPKKKRAGWLE
jgi:hypothetical protein